MTKSTALNGRDGTTSRTRRSFAGTQVMMRLTVCALLGVVMLPFSAGAAQRPTGNPRVQGVVLDAGTNNPIAGARVHVYDNRARPVGIQTRTSCFPCVDLAEAGTLSITDRSGRFEFDEIEGNSFTVWAERAGYERKSPETLRIGDGGSLTNVVIKLTPTRNVTGTISGRIRDAQSGRPAAGISVTLLRREYNDEGQVTFEDAASTSTNDLGEYRMYWVAPGRYYVVADGSARPQTANSNTVQMKYGASVYPGTPDIDRPSVIDLREGSEVTGIDFALVRSSSYRIRGRIVDSKTGRPPAQARVQIGFVHSRGTTSFGVNYNPQSGTFEATDLIPGIYEVNASWDDAKDSTSAVIENSNVDDLFLALSGSPGDRPQISGRITVEGELPAGSTLERFGVHLLPDQGAGKRWNSQTHNGPTVSASVGGSFILKDIPEGLFRVRTIWMPPEFYLKEARLDGEDALARPLSFSRGKDLEIVLSSRGGKLEGVVRSDDSQPVAEISVVLVPDTMRERSELFKNVSVEKNGRFTISGIAPGDYKLFAWTGLDRHEYFDPEVLKRFEEKGRRVHVAGSSSQSVELTVLPMQVVP
jgi:5-hydroxyisourate hydrolase-like protein (transthyretin family)